MPKFISRRLTKAKNCPLCVSGVEADYKDAGLLKRYISERGKILGRGRVGVCARHQRQLTKSIKRARVMAILPYVQG